MKKIILKYLKSNSKKLVLIQLSADFISLVQGLAVHPSPMAAERRLKGKLTNIKIWKETVCAGEPVCIHSSWVESAYAILGRSEVLFPRCVRWSFVERSKPISLFLSVFSSCSSLNSRQRSLVCALTFSFFSLQTYAVLLHFWWFVLVVCASKLWGWSWVGSVLVCLVLMLFVLGN